MSNWLLLSIILIEGFVTISAEIITMRQLIPYVGNSVIVTSLIIGIFLLFLAYGYRRGGQYKTNYIEILKRNFSYSAALLGIGLSYSFILLYFSIFNHHIQNSLISLTFYLMLIIAPLVYILGQTVPITMNLIKSETSTGEIGGKVLHLSTLGSFLGAILTSLLLMNYLGVAWTVFINFCLLLFLTVLLFTDKKRDFIRTISLSVLLVFVYLFNIDFEKETFLTTNHYANYQLIQDKSDDNSKILMLNQSVSSKLNSNNEALPYIELIKKILFQDLALIDKDILVLGAGGFTLSANLNHQNRFTYIDIDQQIKEIVQNHFLKDIQGQFIAEDARHYLQKNQKFYDVIVSDVYSNARTIPQNLVTQQYYQLINKNLSRSGIAVFNIIGRPTLKDPYSKRMDNTIRSVFTECMVLPLQYSNLIGNIIYVCQKSVNNLNYSNNYKNSKTLKKEIYHDNINQSTLDSFKS